MDGVTFCYHCIVFLIWSLSLYYDVNYSVFGPDDTTLTYRGYAGKFKYLTFWNFIIQTLYFGISLANDICGSNVRPSHKGQHRTTLQRWRDNMLATVVFPVGTFVVLTFWGIYAVDRELVYPKRLDKVIPMWLNHVMHTTVLPFLLIDKFLVYHQYPSRKSGIITLLSFALLYLAWILWIAYHANIWVYPILKVMAPVQRALFIFLLLGFFISIYVIGEVVNKFLWRKEIAILHEEKKKKS